MGNFQEKVTFIWDLADQLRGTYKKNEYQKVILPFTMLKRFDNVLEYSKTDVIEVYNKYKDSFENLEPLLMQAARDNKGNDLGFYNYSNFDFKGLLADPENIEENLKLYLDCFSSNVQDIFENFHINDHIARLAKGNLLYLIIKKFSESKVNLHPDNVSNHEMGTIFEELIRKFSEQSNEEAGEHFTPRDIIKLMTNLIFNENGVHLKEKNLIKKIYDPACGTGGMLTSCKEYVAELNDSVDIILYGQEKNDEIYAICKADMLIKGEDSGKIKGPSSTLSNDLFPNDKFDFMICNPPYGTNWEPDEDIVKKEAEIGFNGRFGAGLPKINDGTLLFLEHMLSKMKENEKSRIAVITNASPLFVSEPTEKKPNESQIRRWIITNDYVESIIGLPEQLFYNTGIKTFIWVLTNKKPSEREGKIQLIDTSSKFKKMQKSLGNKRNYLHEDNIQEILRLYSDFKETENSKIFDNDDFGYTKVVVHRPLQLNYQINDTRLSNLFMIKAFAKFAESKSKYPDIKLKEEELGKKKQVAIINELRKIEGIYYNWNIFENKVKTNLKSFNLSPTLIKNIIIALSEHDNTADYVVDKKGNKKPDPLLKDTEKIPIKEDINKFFENEIAIHYPDAWMDRKKDKIGYEINFTKYFYKYQPPRSLEDIEADIKKVTSEIQDLIKEDLNAS